jgi:hypothetical protein
MPLFVEELIRTIGQIAPRHCGDRINHLPKFGLGPLDLVKRISERLLCPLSVFNVGSGCVPTYDLSVFVKQWAAADHEPPIFAVLPKSPLLVFEWNRAGKTLLPPF